MKPTKTKPGSVPANRTLSQKLGRSTTALLATGAATLAASGSALALVLEPPDFSNTFPGHPSVVGETYQGRVRTDFEFDEFSDVDVFHYTGLTPGDAFDLGLNFLDSDSFGASVFAVEAFIGSPLTDSTSDGLFEHLTFVVPGSGELSFLVSTDGEDGSEGYQLRLTSPRSVPEPATIALLAAGLAGALVTRRRRRK